MKSGDENFFLFQAYQKGRKFGNTIWILKDQEGKPCTTFDELSNLDKNHFLSLFQADRNTNIEEIIKVAL